MGMFDGATRASGRYLDEDLKPLKGTVEFTITTLPALNDMGRIAWREHENKFGKKSMRAYLGGSMNGEDVVLSFDQGSPLFEAMAAAVGEAGRDAFELGGVLKVQHHEDKDVGKGNPLKLFRAKYTPAPDGYAAPADEFDDGPF